ncbi:hypothetical protein D1159_00600 [Pseudoflavonifractor sp. 524-17]|uniref:hypothetical protein n=1 Tax=Pseudoflavonifractor sp. 524-17 TaxID=2304577 RepID=UPI001379486B|nr:hypothetical protein [Pseudoflavonifractor sp. 524-17]NCE63111.1 hypothetical protein [Pseudoflavonifractor sp. 524-17]
MKKLNQAVWIISGAALGAAVLVQVLIFWPHSLEWYRGFYYFLGALGLGALAGMVVCLAFLIKDRRILAVSAALPCVGLLMPIVKYRRMITHLSFEGGTSGLRIFVLTPYLICALLGAAVYLFLKNKASEA